MERERLYQLSLIVSVAQGGLLLALYRAVENQLAFTQIPTVHLPLWVIAVTGPTMFVLGATADNLRRWLAATAGWTAIVALLAVWIGWLQTPWGEVQGSSITSVALGCWLIGTFKALMYLQIWANREPFEYAGLFRYSWRNALVAVLTVLLAAGAGIVLLLWGALFDLIGVDFFEWLFHQDWFLFPFFATVAGLGIRRFLELEGVIASIAQLLRTLIFGLLPLIVVVTLLFLAAMPFTGLQPLWDTRSGSLLLLVLLALATFFLNAVYQPDAERPYGSAVHRTIALGLIALPVVGALAIYGLFLRIDQYGWTVFRSWGVTVAGLLMLFAVGYLISVLRYRDDWPTGLSRTNRWGGLALLATVILTQTPVLDYRSLALASQLERLESGEVAFEDFDFNYMKWQLGRPGWLQLEQWRAEYADNTDMLARINGDWYSAQSRTSPDRVFPPGHVPPPDLLEHIYSTGELRLPIRSTHWLVAADLNDDGREDYLLLQHIGGATVIAGHEVSAFVRAPESDRWEQYTVLVDAMDIEPLQAALEGNDIEAVPRPFKDLRIGEHRLTLLRRHHSYRSDRVQVLSPVGDHDAEPAVSKGRSSDTD